MVDPKEAPKGYIAVEYGHCSKCAFNKKRKKCLNSRCMPDARCDEESVIFIRKEKKGKLIDRAEKYLSAEEYVKFLNIVAKIHERENRE